MDIREHFNVDLDIKQNIGKRYARQDEIGTPFCFTIDDQSVTDKTVSVRHRNTMKQDRIGMDSVAELHMPEEHADGDGAGMKKLALIVLLSLCLLLPLLRGH